MSDVETPRPAPEKPERKKRKKIIGFGIVKGVSSGDSLILMGGAVNGSIPSEKHITLSGVTAPMFARNRSAKDAEFAFQSREHLRRKCIGKKVRFVIHHIANAGGRQRNYADVSMDGVDLAQYMLRAGLVLVKMPNSEKAKIHPEKQAMIDIMEEIKKQGLGMWNTRRANLQVRDVNWNADPRTLFEQNKNKTVPGIIDHVREGHVFRIELLGLNLAHTMITMQLAGIHCPRVPKPHFIILQEWERDNKSGPKPEREEPEAFAQEARFYSEARLLHREVEVQLLGIDKMGSIFGSIIFPLGNVTVKLLENGLGKIVPWSAKLNAETNYLRFINAESLAKQRRAGVWENFNGTEPEEKTMEFTAIVMQVYSGDSLQVQHLNEMVRINLASVRCPRLYRGLPDEPLAMEAREHVRRLVIGKKVHVTLEYERAGRRDLPPMKFCTVKLDNMDIAEGLCQYGLATVQRHRPTESRSSRYECLMLAEDSAVKFKKGQFATKIATRPPIQDLTRGRRRKRRDDDDQKNDDSKDEKKERVSSDPRVRKIFPFLQRKTSVEAVVEYCFSGSRVKLYIPSQNSMVSFIIAGVRTPANDRSADSMSSVVTAYVSSKLLQRTVKIDVIASDRGDNFIGSLFVGRLNVATHLIQKGYASVFSSNVDKLKFKDDLFQAQRQAKEKKIGIWKNWVPPVTPVHSDNSDGEEDTRDNGVTSLKEGEQFINVKITEINDPSNFYVQIVGNDTLALVEENMATFSDDVDDVPEDFVPESGRVYAGKFSDNRWHRVKLEGKAGAGSYKAFFMDYGNRDELDLVNIRPLSQDMQSIKALSRAACLAGLKTPFYGDFKEHSIYRFGDLCFDRELLAKVELAEKGGKLHLSLFEATNSVSINNQLVRDGTLRVEESPHARLSNQLTKELKGNEVLAKQDNVGVWVYGDVSDSEGEAAPANKRYDGRVPRKQF